MANHAAQPDVSPISSPRRSDSTAEQTPTDPTHAERSKPLAGNNADNSTTGLVSQPAANEPVVIVEQPGNSGPIRRVTVRQDPIPQTQQQQKQSTSQQPSNTKNGPTKPMDTQDMQREKWTYLELLRCWEMELFAILLAAATVVVIVVLLHYYHDKNVRSWNHTWQINSVFAFLTAIMEASVAFAVGACLGQLRWLWYSRSHERMQIKWIDRLTNAKSAPGAARFALGDIKTSIRHWAFLGAAVIVCLLGVGVFTQQVITVRGQAKDISDAGDPNPANVPIARRYVDQWEFGSTGYQPGDQTPPVWMESAVIAGFTFPANTQQKDSIVSLVNCATGNCTFASYSTLSLCSKCADISDQIICGDLFRNKSSCPAGSLTRLPDNSLSLNASTGVVNITSDDQYPSLSNMTGIGPLVARYVGMGYWDTPAIAKECALYWCVKTYNSTVVNSIFTESEVETWTNLTAPKTSYGQEWNIRLQPESCYENGTKTTECDFRVPSLGQRALQNYLINGSNITQTPGFLQGSVTVPPETNGANWTIFGLAANSIIRPCAAEGECETYQHSFYILETGFTWMARYMSHTIRASNPGYSYGTTSRFDTYYHVRWGWLAYPIAIVFAALIFLLVTIIKSRGTRPWKSSVTALLFHGLVDEDTKQFKKLDDPVEMVKARNWVVTLQDHNGIRRFRIKDMPAGNESEHGEIVEAMVEVAVAVSKAAEGAPN